MLLWRQARYRPLLTILMVAGVAIGVAMIASIDLASNSALRAFEYTAEAMRGKATHVITADPNTIPWSVYVDLRARLQIRNSAPVVTDRVTVRELGDMPMALLGVDPISEGPFRSFTGSSTSVPFSPAAMRFMTEPFTLLASPLWAERRGVSPGDTLTLVFQGRQQAFTVLELWDDSGQRAAGSLDNLLLTDIANAQIFLGRSDSLDRIDLLLTGPRADETVAMLRQELPATVQIEPAHQQYETIRQLTSAFRLNLSALSLLAVVVGTFLIYNTLSFNVTRARRTLGILHALGMVRRQIFALIMMEALVLGLAGSALGLVSGRLLATRLVELVANTYQDMYFLETMRTVVMEPATLAKASLIGIGCTLLGASVPARAAARTQAAQAMQDWGAAPETGASAGRHARIGSLAIGSGGLLLLPSLPLAFVFTGIFACLAGTAFLVPVLLQRAMQGLLRMVAARSMPFLKIALRQPLHRLGQTSVAVAALMISLSVVVGVGSMVGSFRTSVETWLAQVLQADIYMTGARGNAPPFLVPEQLPALQALPGVDQVAWAHETRVRTADFGPLRALILSDDNAKATRVYTSQIPHRTNLWDEAAQQEALMINTAMAHRHQLRAGDTLNLVTPQGVQSFLIAGVSKSYEAVSSILLDDAVYRQFWPEPGLTSVSLTLAAGQDPGPVLAILEDRFNRSRHQVRIMSHRELRLDALNLFDRTFAVTGALQVLAMIVSFMSVLASLMGMMLDQAREFATMKAVGMTRLQIGRLLFMEAGVFGISAAVLAIPVGLLLSVVLVYIVNVRSFGWSLDWTWQPLETVKAMAVGLGASCLACIYPIWHLQTRVHRQDLRME